MNRLAWGLISICSGVVLLTACIVGAYIARFHNYSVGGPAAWGTFGDYLGGCLNAVFGFITVLVVILTFREARQEAKQERDRSNQEQQLSLQMQRLDAALSAWYRITARRFSGVVGMKSVKAPTKYEISSVMHRNVLHKELYASYAKNLFELERHTPEQLQKAFGEAADLLAVIARYCRELDKTDPTRVMTDLYRHLLRRPAAFLSGIGMLEDNYFTADALS